MVEFLGHDDEVHAPAFDLTYLRRLLPFVRPYARGFAVSTGRTWKFAGKARA